MTLIIEGSIRSRRAGTKLETFVECQLGNINYAHPSPDTQTVRSVGHLDWKLVDRETNPIIF